MSAERIRYRLSTSMGGYMGTQEQLDAGYVHPETYILEHFPDADDFHASSLVEAWWFTAEKRDELPRYVEVQPERDDA